MANRLAPAGLVAMLFVAAAVLSLWLWSTRADDVAPVNDDSTAGVAVEERASVEPFVVAAAIPQREAVDDGKARVIGVVYDGKGNAVVGAEVLLTRVGTREAVRKKLFDEPRIEGYPSLRTHSDERGGFTFAGLEPAEYSVVVWMVTASQQFHLARGEVKRCELGLAKGTATVFGEVRQGGALVPNRSVMVGAPGQRMGVPVTADDQGVFRCFVKPGPCTVQAWNHVPGSSARVLACERSVLVASGAEVRCDLDVPDLRLVLSIDDGGTAPVAGLEFEIASEEDLDVPDLPPARPARFGRVSAVLSAADGRSCVFGDLACGTWLVRAKAPGLLPSEPQRVELSARSPHATVLLSVRPAGIVRVVARNLAGEAMVLADAGPVLVTSCGELTGIDLGRVGRGMITSEQFAFVGVPPGRAELRLRDREQAGRTLFLPFDAVPAQPIDVVAGDGNRVELRVERRALVRLRVVDSVGREEPGGLVTVLAGKRQVHSSEKRLSRWRSHLPPDEYRIVVERRTGRSEQRLLVGRQDLDLKLRP